MCHILLNDPQFFSLLRHIDRDLADQRQALGCHCGGVLHKADYPRKPRGCPRQARADCAWRFSFCCHRCRKRVTAPSVRFLGRRAAPTAALAKLASVLEVPARTVLRWRAWWVQIFPTTPLWQASCARFMPPVAPAALPASLLERFAGPAAQSLQRLLAFLSPWSVPQ